MPTSLVRDPGGVQLPYECRHVGTVLATRARPGIRMATEALGRAIRVAVESRRVPERLSDATKGANVRLRGSFYLARSAMM